MNTDKHHCPWLTAKLRQGANDKMAKELWQTRPENGAEVQRCSEGRQRIPMPELTLDYTEQKQCPLPQRPRHPEGGMPTVPLHTRQGPEVQVSDASGFGQTPAPLLFLWVPGLGLVLCSHVLCSSGPIRHTHQSRVPHHPPPFPTPSGCFLSLLLSITLS